ncbi:MAG: hypothetical protein ACLP9Y_01865 [Mycobacterium sp.]
MSAFLSCSGCCHKGQTALHATGVNPGWLNERVVVALTGACTSIKSIQVREFSDNSHIESADMLRAIGYGLPQGSTPWMENVGDRGYTETVALTCHLLGVDIDGVASEKHYLTASKTHHLAGLDVPEGSMAGLMYKYTAMVKGEPFMSLEEIWYVDPDDVPIPVHEAGDYYSVIIEGAPTSVKAQFELKASVDEDLRFHGDDSTLPSYYATAVSMIQTIPNVCDHAPGIVYPTSFANYSPDLRVRGIA